MGCGNSMLWSYCAATGIISFIAKSRASSLSADCSSESSREYAGSPSAYSVEKARGRPRADEAARRAALRAEVDFVRSESMSFERRGPSSWERGAARSLFR